MFGSYLSIPVPDIDRTDYLLALGANPLASNGSLMTAPDARGRLRGIQERGGRIVVIDPRRSRTAESRRRAPLHPPRNRRALPVRIRHTSFRRGPRRPRPARRALRGRRRGRSGSPRASRPSRSRTACGIVADDIRRIARDLAAAERGGGLRPDRHVHAGVRNARELARRRPERAHRQPRPARAARCSRRPPPGRRTRAERPAAARA